MVSTRPELRDSASEKTWRLLKVVCSASEFSSTNLSMRRRTTRAVSLRPPPRARSAISTGGAPPTPTGAGEAAPPPRSETTPPPINPAVSTPTMVSERTGVF